MKPRRYANHGLLRVLLVALLLQSLSFVALSQEPDRPLRFVGNEQLPPYISVGNQQPVGLVVDLARAVAEKAHLSIRVEALHWPDAQAQVLAGEADALLFINPTPEREKLYDFSDALLESHFHIFRKNTRPEIQNLNTLHGKRVGVGAGSFAVQYLQKYDPIQLVLLPNWKAGFEMLDSGQLDAIFVDRWVGEYEISRHKIAGMIVVDPPIVTDTARIAVKKGNQALLGRINFGLQAIQQDGTRQQIEEKWRAKEVIYMTQESVDRMMLYAALSGIALLMGIFLKILSDARSIRKINRDLEKRSQALADENQERQQAEAALRQAHDTLEQRVAERTAELRVAHGEARMREAYLQALFNSALDAILIADDEGQYIDANPAACDLLGYPRDELLRLSLWDVTPPSIRELAQAQWRKFGAVGKQSGEYLLHCKDGVERAVEYRAVAHFLPGRHLSVLRDITERKQSEKILREERDRFEKIAATVPGMIASFRLRPDGSACFPYASPAIHDLYGLRPEEVAESADPLWALVPPEDIVRMEASIAASAQSMNPWRDEFRVQHPIRGETWIEGHSMPISEPDGSILWHGYLQDITPRKRAEEVLQAQAEELQAQTEELQAQTEELQAQAEELQAQTEELQAQAEELQVQTEELQARNTDLDRFNQAMVGREMDVIRLKQQINELSMRLGLAKPYPLDFLNAADAHLDSTHDL